MTTTPRRFAARLAFCLVAAGLIAAAGAPRLRADDAPVFDFGAGAQSWRSDQQGSSVGVTRDAENVKVGAASLEWSYTPTTDAPTTGTQDVHIPDGATCLDFWIKGSEDSNVQVHFFMKNGADYRLPTHLAKGKWEHYHVSASDLTLGPTKDPAGGFDPAQVQLFLLMDVSFFSAKPGEAGPRKVWLSNVAFTKENAPQRRYTQTVDNKSEVVFDDFDAETPAWEVVPGIDLSDEKDGNTTFLRAKYQQGAKAPHLFRIEDHIDARYAQTSAVKLVARASRAARIGVEFRTFDGTYNGPMYRAYVDLPAGKEWQTKTIPISEFKLLPGAKDGTSKTLDMKDAWLLSIGDATEVDGAPDEVLEIDSLSAVLAG